ncbi:MAG: hypothetical protein SOI04_07900 [Bifidobacterium thermacidophilum]|jgi:hypothetical protein|uniref:hypothetical protein n=1 Tax=Bifidobacterium thermacidophilum TaxID=246618 RepID=UPI002F350349
MDSSISKRNDSTPDLDATTIVHYIEQPLVEGVTATALCGQRMVIHLNHDGSAVDSAGCVVCALCAAAWELKDVQIPKPKQGELFS